MGPIRPHKKSRTGCRTCRGRRVKCDEAHPICKNCARRELNCIYDAPPPPPRRPPSPPCPPARHFLTLLHYSPTSYSISFPGLDLASLELIHHYSTSTYLTFTPHAPGLPVWREEVPRLGFIYPFVLHSTLAVTSLHLSCLRPHKSRTYEVLAASHYQRASVSLRSVLPDNSSIDRNALFIATSFIAIYVLAVPHPSTLPLQPHALAWIPIMRGIPAVLRGSWNKVNSHFRPLNDVPKISSPVLPELPSLDWLCAGIPEKGEEEAIREGVVKLQYAWETYRRAPAEFWLPAAFAWPASISDRFVYLLTELRPRALVLLAYYGGLFSTLKSFWWIGERPRVELEIIEKIVGEEWRVQLRWVKRLIENPPASVKPLEEVIDMGKLSMQG